jgi:hypothetical protein
MPNFNAVPEELRLLPNWVLWKYEPRDKGKPTKMPYQANGSKAMSNKCATWSTFQVVSSVLQSGGYDGLGFMFSGTPYTGIDLDDPRYRRDPETGENIENPDFSVDRAAQLRVYSQFDSYSERSPSGLGCHIIVKGKTPKGKRKASIEVYPDGRFFTMTGDVCRDMPIAECSIGLMDLYQQMGGDANPTPDVDAPSTISDKDLLNLALAHNTKTFEPLHNGDFSSYHSQSEGDQAYMNIIAYYTDSREQCDRIFRNSKLMRDKVVKNKKYLSNTIKKAFDQKVVIDFSSMDDAWSKIKAGSPSGKAGDFESSINGSIPLPAANGSVAQRLEPSAHNGLVAGSSPAASTIPYPPGLMGEIARFIYNAAQKPVQEIAIAGAIGLMAGICGKAFNVSNTGLNYYILMIAGTGKGKEAMASGISKLVSAVNASNLTVPLASSFIGPSAIASKQGLHKYLVKNSSCFVSIIGEFGFTLASMSNHSKASTYQLELQAALLDIYHKSGAKDSYGGSAYSDQEKNSAAILAPSFSILGESTPETFYRVLDEQMIASGLLPRFTIIEYNGERVRSNDNKIDMPSIQLTFDLGNLANQCKTIMGSGNVINIHFTDDALALSKKIDRYADDMVNTSDKPFVHHLWNRAHLKALKLAALVAVGINRNEPTITIDHLNWGMAIVDREIRALSSKFENNEIGSGNDEIKQNKDMIKCLLEYVEKPFQNFKGYGAVEKQHANRVINNYMFNRRISTLSSFRTDTRGKSFAVQRGIKNLVDDGILVELRNEEYSKYQVEGKLWKISAKITDIEE